MTAAISHVRAAVPAHEDALAGMRASDVTVGPGS